jgi:hypothetical protein
MNWKERGKTGLSKTTNIAAQSILWPRFEVGIPTYDAGWKKIHNMGPPNLNSSQNDM